MVRQVEADVLQLDGDAASALEVHGVEILRPHVARVARAAQLEYAVGQRGLAMVDVRDHREAPCAGDLHLRCRRYQSAAESPARAVSSGAVAEVRVRPLPSYGCLPTTREDFVANIKSQIKRNRQNEKRHDRNKAVRSELKTRVKRAITAAEHGADDADRAAQAADKRLDKAASKGRIHKNAATRRKGPLHKRLNKLAAEAES